MTSYFFSYGSHRTREDGLCAMEWVSYLAGEPHSDAPDCVSPMLAEFCVSLNDVLSDEQRQRLRPYLARTIGTRGDGLDDSRRWLCADWIIREYTPAFLELVPSLRLDAEALRVLPPILAVENVQRAVEELRHARQSAAAAWTAVGDAARNAAWDAARDAAWDAAGDAAWDAAGDAAVAAAVAAAGDAAVTAARAAAGDAAVTAARDAAVAAAWDAAWDAAVTAARAALAPSVLALQNSVLNQGGLLDRMLPLEPLVLPSASEWREVCNLVV